MKKNIIITGAADGLGLAISKELKDENLILIDKDEKTLKEAQKLLN